MQMKRDREGATKRRKERRLCGKKEREAGLQKE